MSVFLEFIAFMIVLVILQEYWYVVLAAFILIAILVSKASRKRKEQLLQLNVNNYDNLSGEEFEGFISTLLEKCGYTDVKCTPKSGDFGVDVLATRYGKKYAIQCKRYTGKVGNHAVQEAFSGKAYYDADIAVVATNNYFTSAAIETAEKIGVELWDRNMIEKMINSIAIQHEEEPTSLKQKNDSLSRIELYSKMKQIKTLIIIVYISIPIAIIFSCLGIILSSVFNITFGIAYFIALIYALNRSKKELRMINDKLEKLAASNKEV